MAEKEKGILGNLMDFSDPAKQQALFQMGLSMMQPQQPGTTFGQNVFNSMGDAMNYLSNLERARNQAGIQERELQTAESRADSAAVLAAAQEQSLQAEAENQEKNTQIRLFEALSEREKNQATLDAAKLKARGADGLNKEILKGLFGIYEKKTELGEPWDPRELISAFDAISSGASFDNVGYNPETKQFFIRSNSIREIVDEDSGQSQPMVVPVSEQTAKDLGFKTDTIKTQATQAYEKQKARSVPEVSKERGVKPTYPDHKAPAGPSLQRQTQVSVDERAEQILQENPQLGWPRARQQAIQELSKQ